MKEFIYSRNAVYETPRDLPKVFDRFFQVEEHLTRRHGGRIWVESEEGKSSVFIFLLPMEGAERPAKDRTV